MKDAKICYQTIWLRSVSIRRTRYILI